MKHRPIRKAWWTRPRQKTVSEVDNTKDEVKKSFRKEVDGDVVEEEEVVDVKN